MNRTAVVLLSGIIFGLLVACAPAEPPPVVTIAEACAVENDGMPASVEGFFQVDFMVFCTDSCTVGFADTPGGESPLSPDIKIGTGANEIRELPDDFTEADFVVTTQDGKTVGLNDRVQLSGRMSVGTDVCLMYVDQVRSAP